MNSRSDKSRQIVLKMQRSIVTSEDTCQILLYNRTRSIEHEQDATGELLELMGENLKIFVLGVLVETEEGMSIRLLRRIKDRSW